MGEAIFDADPFEAAKGGDIVRVKADGSTLEVAPLQRETFEFSQVGSEQTVTTTQSTTDVAPDDLGGIFYIDIKYQETGGSRGTSTQRMSAWVRKADLSTTAYGLQLQGLGNAHVNIIKQSSDSDPLQLQAGGSTYNNIRFTFYNFQAPGLVGPAGPAGADGAQGPMGALSGGGVDHIVKLADEAAYTALSTKDPATLYFW